MVKAACTDDESIGWSKTSCTGASRGCSSPGAGVTWTTWGGSGSAKRAVAVAAAWALTGLVAVGALVEVAAVCPAGCDPAWQAESSMLATTSKETRVANWCLKFIYVPPVAVDALGNPSTNSYVPTKTHKKETYAQDYK
jgi:hypothetical protein